MKLKDFILVTIILAVSIGIAVFLHQSQGIVVTSRPITTPPARVVRVVILADHTPEDITLTLGDGVVWENGQTTPIIVSGSDYFSSGLIAPGEDYSFQFLQAGEFNIDIGHLSQRVIVSQKEVE